MLRGREGVCRFKVPLPAGRSLRATVSFCHASGNIDVRLFAGAANEVAASEGTGDTETASAAAAGEFTLRVHGYNGAANSCRLAGDRAALALPLRVECALAREVGAWGCFPESKG
jgi:hypothetical protein